MFLSNTFEPGHDSYDILNFLFVILIKKSVIPIRFIALIVKF